MAPTCSGRCHKLHSSEVVTNLTDLSIGGIKIDFVGAGLSRVEIGGVVSREDPRIVHPDVSPTSEAH